MTKEIKKERRNSNIEFLRIVAMFMVLLLHANITSLGLPTASEAMSSPLPTFFRALGAMFGLFGVNIFVLISGWFGIRFSVRRLLKFIFTCVFILSFNYLMGLILGYAEFSFAQIAECLFLRNNATWFIKAYIGLFILSPLLNLFCDNASKKLFATIVVLFFVFQTIYGFLTNSAPFITDGFSTFSFIGLYMLARYVKMYGLIKNYGMLFCLSMTLMTVAFYFTVRYGWVGISIKCLSYVNPLCITGAVGIVAFTSSLKVRCNKIINTIAASAFSVYICHICNTWTKDLFIGTSKSIYYNFSGTEYLLILLGFLTGVYILSFVIFSIQNQAWNVARYIYKVLMQRQSFIVSK